MMPISPNSFQFLKVVSRPFALLICLIIALVGMFSCGSDQKSAANKLSAGLEVDGSEIYLPVTISYSQIEDYLNQEFKDGIVADSTYDDDKMAMYLSTYDKVGVFQVPGKNLLSIKLPTLALIKRKIGTKRNGQPKTIDIDIKANVWIETPIEIDDNWNFKTQCSFTKLEWAEKPEAKFGPLSVGIEKQVEKMLQGKKASLPQEIDHSIAEAVDLAAQMNQIWKKMQRPMLVDQQLHPLWVYVAPGSLNTSQITMGRNGVSFIAGASFKLNAAHKNTLVTNQLSSLPTHKQLKNSSNSYKLNLLYELGFNDMSIMLNKVLKDQKFTVAKQQFSLGDAKVKLNNNLLEIHLKAYGDISGELVMTGIPSLDKEEQTIYVKDTDFTVENSEAYVQLADWLMHGEIKNTIAKEAVFSLKPFNTIDGKKISELLAETDGPFKIEAKASNIDFKAKELALTATGIEVIVSANGTLELAL
ncbi:MAG: DUF4403 family protein, partial [Bacteroidetes bacterium]|nr:DUF4403 family protein [Bacteroidota bacterium]